MKKLKLEWMLERSYDQEKEKDLLKILENGGFSSILIRCASFFPDPFGMAHQGAFFTKDINFMVAINPAMMHPVYCAMQISTFQKIHGDRISVNVVSGANPVEQNIFNDSVLISDRYSRSGEFARIIKKLVRDGEIKEFDGNFYNIKDVSIEKGTDFEIVFAGSSDRTIELANNFGSAHYYSMETSKQYAESRSKIKVDSAIKTTMIVEETSKKAWDVTELILKNVTEDGVNLLKKNLSSYESENQKRQQALHDFSINNLNVEEGIWTGMGLLRGGAITSMVGSYEEIANLIEKFYNNGLSRILIGASPETYYATNFVNGVIPILKMKKIV